jgi:CheY-like chemotaxis protein
LELAYHVAPEAPELVIGDRHRLRQIVVNLVGNAIKFTDAGEVVLDTALESQSDGQATLHFFVRDTGVGIPEADRRRIFEAFEQADESSTRRFSGTGLGLAISARLVELMGGKIWVESESSRGSTFHFTALFGVAAPKRPPDQRPPSELLEGLRVMVVDDSATNCFILEEIMRNWRMRVRCANSGREALDALHEGKRRGEHYDLVLVDAHMPGIGGVALIEEIQKDSMLRSTIAIMLTSNDRPEDLKLSEQLGVSAYLIKPVKQSELFNVIAQALGAPTPRRPAPRADDLARRLRPLKILLAEDSVVNQRLARALLEPRGHTLVIAGDGREAVRQVEEDHFDLVLMDVQMPEMDGLEATREIRRREEATGRHVPIIAMTAHAMKGDRERCLEVGMDSYVSKPVRAADLFAAITGEIPDALRMETETDSESEEAAEKEEPAPEKEETTPERIETGATVEDGGAKPEEAEQTPAPAGLLDWEAALAKTQLEPATLRELAEVFLQESPQLLEEIHAALEAGDAPRVRRCAHTIKGSAAVFAAEPTTAAAAHLEDLGKRNELDQAPAVLEELERQYGRLAPALRAIARAESSQEAQE